MHVTIKFQCGLQVGLYPGPQSIASRPFKCIYHLNFPFIDSSIWLQDALGYIILITNTHREKSLFLFSYSTRTRKNSRLYQLESQVHPWTNNEAKGIGALIREVWLYALLWNEDHFSSQITWNKFSLKNKFWLFDEAGGEAMLGKISGCHIH